MEKGGVIKHDQKKSPKTGEWGYMKPEIDASKCIGCQTCVPYCPEAVMEMRRRSAHEMKISPEIAKNKDVVGVDYEYCKGCGVCSQICPVKAISMRK